MHTGTDSRSEGPGRTWVGSSAAQSGSSAEPPPERYPARSPSGRRVVPPEGPPDAELLLVGESPAQKELEQGRPFVGRAGKVLDSLLVGAGIDRSAARVLNAVPCQAPGNDFRRHDEADLAWGLELLRRELEASVAAGAKLVVPLGENPLAAVAGPELPRPPRWGETDGPNERSRIGAWRGSLIPLAGFGEARCRNDRELHAAIDPQRRPWLYALPTYHPAAIARRYEWHRSSLDDLKRARRFLDDRWPWPKPRRWHLRPPDEDWIERIVDHEHLVAFDTEQEPYGILALVGEEDVYSFGWDLVGTEALRDRLRPLFESPQVLVAAHNAQHDLTWLRQAGFDPQPPYVDTGGLAHVLCNALPRSLSPGLSARFTAYPFHKWLVDLDPLRYCGWDALVAYDAYWSATRRVVDRGLLPVSEHDHRLLQRCLQMQWRGVRVDEERREAAEVRAEKERGKAEGGFKALSEPVVRAELPRFEKPHLFKERKQCQCCGGGERKRAQCWSCAGFSEAPRKSELAALAQARGLPVEGLLKGELAEALLQPCRPCGGEGVVERWLDWKWDGPATNDVLYRGFGIRPRRYKGSETRRADQLAPVAERGTPPQRKAVEAYLALVEADSELNEMQQLTPDLDGRLHSQFDPWGTGSGRVASSKPLLQRGRNMQNIPRKYRDVIVADPGHVFFAPDMEQIEARCVAVLSGEERLRRWFREPLDWSASPSHGSIDQHAQLQKLYHERGIKLSRDQVKRSTYAFTYGGEAQQVAIELSKDAHSKGVGVRVETAEVERLRRLFYKLLPGIRRWQAEASEEVARTRKLVSPTGRQRWWLGYVTQNVRTAAVRPTDYVLQEFERGGKRWAQILARKVQKEVWSFQPQDMAAWVLAEGLERLDEERRRAGLRIEPLLHIHDEVVLQVPERDAARARPLIREALTVERWGLRFECDVGEPARNWRDAKSS